MAKRKAPGKFYRKGITLLEIAERFDSEEKAEAWFIEQRWPDGIACPHCGSVNVANVKSRKPQPFRCRDCRKHFSIKTGTRFDTLASALYAGTCRRGAAPEAPPPSRSPATV